MTYLSKVQLDDERVEAAPRFSNMAQYGPPTMEFIIVALLWNIAGMAFLDPLSEARSPEVRLWIERIYVVGLAFLGLRFVLRMVARFIRMRFRELAITNRRYMEKDGVVNIRFWSTDLERIVRVVIEQSWLGRMFNYGAVTIVTVGEVSHTTTGVCDPIGLQQALHARMESARAARAADAAGRGLADLGRFSEGGGPDGGESSGGGGATRQGPAATLA